MKTLLLSESNLIKEGIQAEKEKLNKTLYNMKGHFYGFNYNKESTTHQANMIIPFNESTKGNNWKALSIFNSRGPPKHYKTTSNTNSLMKFSKNIPNSRNIQHSTPRTYGNRSSNNEKHLQIGTLKKMKSQVSNKSSNIICQPPWHQISSSTLYNSHMPTRHATPISILSKPTISRERINSQGMGPTPTISYGNLERKKYSLQHIETENSTNNTNEVTGTAPSYIISRLYQNNSCKQQNSNSQHTRARSQVKSNHYYHMNEISTNNRPQTSNSTYSNMVHKRTNNSNGWYMKLGSQQKKRHKSTNSIQNQNPGYSKAPIRPKIWSYKNSGQRGGEENINANETASLVITPLHFKKNSTIINKSRDTSATRLTKTTTSFYKNNSTNDQLIVKNLRINLDEIALNRNACAAADSNTSSSKDFFSIAIKQRSQEESTQRKSQNKEVYSISIYIYIYINRK